MRIFWPVYLGTALVGVVAAWLVAPSLRTSVSKDLRGSWAHGIATLRGIDLFGMEYAESSRKEAERVARLAAEVAAEAAAMPSKPERLRPNAGSEPVAPRVAVRRDPAAPQDDTDGEGESYSAPAQTAGETYHPLPSTRGILHADYKDAEWGIVNAVTPYRALSDNEVVGNAGVGSVFAIEQRQPAEGGGVEFVGNFPNRPHEEPVIIPASKLYCFTGSYESLTDHQKRDLTAYYRKRGEAERLKRELMRENGSKSPFFAQAVEAKSKWDEMVKTAEALEVSLRTDKMANASRIRDQLARMKGDMAVQQAKVKDLSDKHKAWKEKNAPQMTDPEDDPRLQKLRDEMQGFAKSIPGLAL